MADVKDQIQQLFEKMLQGELSAAERLSLQKLVQTSKESETYYLDLCQMHAMLSDQHGAFAAGVGSVVSPERSKKNLLPIISFVVSLAALIALAFVGLNLKKSQEVVSASPYRGEPVASLTESFGAKFAFGNTAEGDLQKGDSVLEGTYNLQKGFIQLSYKNGNKVIVESPSTFELFANNRIVLNKGKLSATVTPAGKGFTVQSLGVSVVDIGTEFSVYVKENEYLETHVFKGLVELEMNFEIEDVKHKLVEGQAARVMVGSAGPVLAGVDLRDDFFIRHIEEPVTSYSEMITDLQPIAYYPMSINRDGVTLEDKSDFRNDGKAADVRDSASLWTAGKIGSAIQLSGSNNKAYVYVADYPKAKKDRLTVTAWVYAESRPQWATIVKNWGNRLFGQFHFGLNPAGLLDIEIAQKGEERVHVTESKAFPLKSWQHVAFVHNGKRVKVFRNGEVVASGKVNGINYPIALKKMSIGTKLDDYELMPAPGSPGHWDGRLDELAIFNKALTDEQIKELYLKAK
ncbi:MAG: FecR domain-containing protein [Lentisphaeraceae bacterium]|nr:FecR domain-containing protein [Lentisphaeraceae bacterium]